ncbi:MAG TPA: exopolysaccharide biosynthesis protein [Dongiaceae bacterium]
MTTRHAGDGRRLGEILAELAARPEPDLTLGELIQGMGDRGHGLLIAALALPNVLPIYLPGLSAVFGLPLVFIAFQLVLGRRNLWLPPVLARRSIARATFARMAGAIAPWLARLERALRPRWPEFLGPMAERLAGLLAILLGLLLSLPIPLTNIPLAVPLVLIGLGLAERDGLMLAIGLAVGAIVAIAVLALGSALILAALAWLAALI